MMQPTKTSKSRTTDAGACDASIRCVLFAVPMACLFEPTGTCPAAGYPGRTRQRRCFMRPKLLLFAFLILPSLAAQAQHQFKVLHAFGAGKDGGGVWDSVILDKNGNVYGTTSGGGAYNAGTAFRLTPSAKGNWKESVLHNFGSHHDGGPWGGVAFDSRGNLYGTTIAYSGKYNAGIAFELKPGKPGWVETALYNFGGPGDPTCCPFGSLATDARGNLYGTGYSAFELSPGPKGWAETILHVFAGKNGDGSGPEAGPIRDAAGNLYGTTLHGGGSKECGDGCGTVWELSPPAMGSPTQGWTEHILHRFGVGDNLAFPGVGQLAMDPQGNLYGAVLGGTHRAGVIYKLSPASTTSSTTKTWRETILYNFTGRSDGGYPEGVILDAAGNLYGICGVGGAYGEGTVFKLSPQADGSWKHTLLHTFTGSDGAEPVANPTLGPDGKLYGTTATGGKYGGGVVFQLAP